MKILTTSASEQNINVIPRLFLSTYTLQTCYLNVVVARGNKSTFPVHLVNMMVSSEIKL